MKRIALIASVLLMAASCAKSPVATLSGTAEGLGDTCLVLKRLDLNNLVPVDTIAPGKDGGFNCKVNLPGETPTFYYLFDGDRQVAALVLLPGDKVTLKANSYDYEVSGSQESALLKQVDEAFYAAKVDMEGYADRMAVTSDPGLYRQLAEAMSRRYVDYKRAAMKQIMDNSKSITSAIIPFQRFNEQLPVFNEHTDVILFKQLYDSLQTVYPKSQYVVALGDEISRRETAFDLSQKIGRMQSISYPLGPRRQGDNPLVLDRHRCQPEDVQPDPERPLCQISSGGPRDLSGIPRCGQGSLGINRTLPGTPLDMRERRIGCRVSGPFRV